MISLTKRQVNGLTQESGFKGEGESLFFIDPFGTFPRSFFLALVAPLSSEVLYRGIPPFILLLTFDSYPLRPLRMSLIILTFMKVASAAVSIKDT